MIKALLRAGLPAAVCLALSPLAQATESGADSIGAGAEGFLAGALPPAGWYGVFYANHYHASQFNNEDGKSSVPGFGLTADVLVPRLLYMSDSRLWGGRLRADVLAQPESGRRRRARQPQRLGRQRGGAFAGLGR